MGYSTKPCVVYSAGAVQYSRVLYSTIQESTVQYNTVEYYSVQYRRVQYSTIPHTVRYCPVLSPRVMFCQEIQLSAVIKLLAAVIKLLSAVMSQLPAIFIPSLADNFSPCLKNVPTNLSFDVFCKKFKINPNSTFIAKYKFYFLPLLPYCEICQFV